MGPSSRTLRRALLYALGTLRAIRCTSRPCWSGSATEVVTSSDSWGDFCDFFSKRPWCWSCSACWRFGQSRRPRRATSPRARRSLGRWTIRPRGALHLDLGRLNRLPPIFFPHPACDRRPLRGSRNFRGIGREQSGARRFCPTILQCLLTKVVGARTSSTKARGTRNHLPSKSGHSSDVVERAVASQAAAHPDTGPRLRCNARSEKDARRVQGSLR